jgi:hypothetical protein
LPDPAITPKRALALLALLADCEDILEAARLEDEEEEAPKPTRRKASDSALAPEPH